MTDAGQHAAWEERYGAAPVWSGKVNDAVRAWCEALPDAARGAALDLACGEGGDALWLAAEGWSVTGVDFAATAIARARAAAAERRLEVEFIAADLTAWVPTTTFDLVNLSFFHESHETRLAVWRVAASAVAAGGTLLVTAHAPDPDPAAPGPPPHTRFELGELVDAMGAGWSLETRTVRREGLGRHAGHIVTDLIAAFTLTAA